MTATLSLVRLLLKGNLKALVGFVGTLAFALGGAADGGITLGEALFALAAACGVGAGVRQIPNTGPLANATEVPVVEDALDLVDDLTDALGLDPASRIAVDIDSLAKAVDCCLVITVDGERVGGRESEA